MMEKQQSVSIHILIHLLMTACLVVAALAGSSRSPKGAAAAGLVDQLPVLWSAGGISAGNDGAGQASRIAVDELGNIAVVSGPSLATQLAVTSYTSGGTFRWRSSISPSSGVFLGDWVAAAPGGDFIAVGHNISNSSGNPIGISLVRFGSSGTGQWRVDLPLILPAVGKLVVDSAGNAYLAFNSIGDGQDIQLHRYDPAGGLDWSVVINTGFFANDIATSLALSPDETEIALSGDVTGGALWITALYDTASGGLQWSNTAPEGVAARDVVVDEDRVYVTGTGNDGIDTFLSVIGYDRATGARLWRTDTVPADATGAAGLRIAQAEDGRIVVAGQATRGFLDWYTASFDTDGNLLWGEVRDGGLNTDEFPRGVFIQPNGTAVVTGPGGPNLPGGYIPGVTVGYGPGGAPLWEGFSAQATTWAVGLPNGDVCSTGGYDALVTCWRTAAFMTWLPMIMQAP